LPAIKVNEKRASAAAIETRGF